MNIIVKIDDKTLLGIPQTAREAGHTHGIGYWADWITRTRIRERDTGIVFNLGKRSLSRGLRLAIEGMLSGSPDSPAIPTSVDKNGLNGIDGPGADYIIQLACFGEEKYA